MWGNSLNPFIGAESSDNFGQGLNRVFFYEI